MLFVDDGDADGLAGAGLDAGRGFAGGQAIAAHVALAHDSQRRIVLRHFVRAFEHAILAADALIIEVPDDAGRGIFFVSEHRATRQATRIDAMMARSRDCCLKWRRSGSSMQ